MTPQRAFTSFFYRDDNFMLERNSEENSWDSQVNVRNPHCPALTVFVCFEKADILVNFLLSVLFKRRPCCKDVSTVHGCGFTWWSDCYAVFLYIQAERHK